VEKKKENRLKGKKKKKRDLLRISGKEKTSKEIKI